MNLYCNVCRKSQPWLGVRPAPKRQRLTGVTRAQIEALGFTTANDGSTYTMLGSDLAIRACPSGHYLTYEGEYVCGLLNEELMGEAVRSMRKAELV